MALPLTVIGGFLGAGKTTLLKHLLEHSDSRRLAVLINDFGALNIDASLIKSTGANSIELSNGCVCCSLGDDLVQQLVLLEKTAGNFDHVIIEASGVGDPWKIAQIGMVSGAYRLDSVIVVVDTETIAGHLTDELMSDSILRQVARADILVANKGDLCSIKRKMQAKSLLVAHIKTPHCLWVECRHSNLNINLALGNYSTIRTTAGETTSSRATFSDLKFREISHRPDLPQTFASASFTHNTLLNKTQVRVLFDAMREYDWHSVFRGKAILPNNDGWVEWHKVGDRENWFEHAQATSGPSQLVLIGAAIDERIFIALVEAGWQHLNKAAKQ
jgi:G3E family GTPase